MNNFIFLKRNLVLQDGTTIWQNAVGLIVQQGNDYNTWLIQFVRPTIELVVFEEDIERFDPNQTGDKFSKKVCNVCHLLLDVNCFSKNQNGKNNRTVRRPSCNSCRKFIDGQSIPTNARRDFLLGFKKPSFTIFTCPICEKTTIPGVTSKIVLDHNHLTGQPRTWICDSCNTGIGRFKDDPVLLQRAISYLLSYE